MNNQVDSGRGLLERRGVGEIALDLFDAPLIDQTGIARPSHDRSRPPAGPNQPFDHVATHTTGCTSHQTSLHWSPPCGKQPA